MKEHILLSSPCRLLILNKQFYEMSGIAEKKWGRRPLRANPILRGGGRLRHCQSQNLHTKVRFQRKKTMLFGNFSQHGGGGLPKSQNFFCKFTKYFFVCQIHSEVLKHVLQMGG